MTTTLKTTMRELRAEIDGLVYENDLNGLILMLTENEDIDVVKAMLYVAIDRVSANIDYPMEIRVYEIA